MVRVTADIPGGILYLTMPPGLPDPAMLAAWLQAILDEADKFRLAGVPFDLLADITQSAIYDQEGAEAVRSNMEKLRERGMRKSANIIGTMMQKMQIARLAQSDDHRFFQTREEAMAWLKA